MSSSSPWQSYNDNAAPEDRWLLGLMLLPVLFCFTTTFHSALPPWLLGFFQAALTHRWFRRYPRMGAGALILMAIAVIAANALLQYSYLSGAWTYRIIHVLWFLLAIPAGLHFWGIAAKPEQLAPKKDRKLL